MTVLTTLTTLVPAPNRVDGVRLSSEAADDLRSIVYDTTKQQPPRRIDADEAATVRSSMPDRGVDAIERALRDARDPRTIQFLIAVRALRVDMDSARSIPTEELTAMRAAASEIFNIENDIPREKRPIEIPQPERTPVADDKDMRAERPRDVETDRRPDPATSPVHPNTRDVEIWEPFREVDAAANHQPEVGGGASDLPPKPKPALPEALPPELPSSSADSTQRGSLSSSVDNASASRADADPGRLGTG